MKCASNQYKSICFFCTKCLQPAYLWPAVREAVVLILANFLLVLDHKSKLDVLTYSLQWDWIQLRYNSCMRLTDYICTIHVGGNSPSERLFCSNNRHRELNAWSACNREINRRDENKSIDGLKRRLSAVRCTLFSKRCSQTFITSKIALSVLLSSFYNLPLSLFHFLLLKVSDQSRRQCVRYFIDAPMSDIIVKQIVLSFLLFVTIQRCF